MLIKLTNMPRGEEPEPVLLNTADITIAERVEGCTIVNIRDQEYSVWIQETPNEIFEKVLEAEKSRA